MLKNQPYAITCSNTNNLFIFDRHGAKNLPQKKTLGGGSREVVNAIAKAKLMMEDDCTPFDK